MFAGSSLDLRSSRCRAVHTHVCMQVPERDPHSWGKALTCRSYIILNQCTQPLGPKHFVLVSACRQVPARHLRSWAKDEDGARALFVYTHGWAFTTSPSHLEQFWPGLPQSPRCDEPADAGAAAVLYRQLAAARDANVKLICLSNA